MLHRKEQIESIYLAKVFFLQNGYVVFERAEAPDVIVQTAHFKYLCPAAASYLRKTLLPASGQQEQPPEA